MMRDLKRDPTRASAPHAHYEHERRKSWVGIDWVVKFVVDWATGDIGEWHDAIVTSRNHGRIRFLRMDSARRVVLINRSINLGSHVYRPPI